MSRLDKGIFLLCLALASTWPVLTEGEIVGAGAEVPRLRHHGRHRHRRGNDGGDLLEGLVEMEEGYNRLVLPPAQGGPLKVNVSINLRNVLEVNEISQMLTLESSIRMWWEDQRVSPVIKRDSDEDFVSVSDAPSVSRFWVPDLFVDRARSLRAPSVQVRPATLRVYPGGKMRYSARVNYDVACNMDFHYFPVDEQVCEIKFESFGYTSEQMELAWVPEKCQVTADVGLDQFDAEVVFQSSYDTDYYDLSYPGVILRIYLRRKLGSHLLQTYLPSALFVSAAFLSLLVDPSSVPGRVSMATMTMITLVFMFGAVRKTTPKVSYVNLLDVWMVACICFIFLVFLEFSLVTYLLRKDRKAAAEKVEKTGVTVLPSLFVLFNVAYWITIGVYS